MGTGKGVEIREKSIRISFTWNGQRCRETLEIQPSVKNINMANLMAQEIQEDIKFKRFDYSKYFPDSPRAPKSKDVKTLGDMCDLWIKTKGQLATATKDQYKNACNVWKKMFGADTPITKLNHTLVASKIGSHPWASARLLNSYLVVLRGVFKLAGRDFQMDNPMEGIDNSKVQKTPPDPLTRDEMEAVLKWMEENCDVVVWAYYEFAFLTGMRPEELIALKWEDLDAKASTIRVQRARSFREIKNLKTHNTRDVDLVGRAIKALEYMADKTKVGNDGFIFRNPVTGRPWNDERSQRDHYWKPALKAAGVRARRSYCTRHTYATNALLAGVNPSYVSGQLGHTNAQMLFTVYAKWINGADRGRERDKLESMLKGEE